MTADALRLRRPRLLARTYAAVLPLVVLGQAPAALALGDVRHDGDDPGSGLSIPLAIAIYVGIPLLVYLVVAVLTFAPASTRGPRYRPGLGWRAAPVWFGGPRTPGTDDETPLEGTGGVSAHW